MKSNPAKTFSALAAIIFGFTAIFFLSNFLEKNRPALPEDFEDEDLALQGARLKDYSLGFEGLIADWYWMKSLQYIGDKVVKSEKAINMDNMKELNPRLLYPYLDNATTLDTKFLIAYSYGSIVLPAIDKEQAIKLAEKGIANNPNEWQLYQNLGYIYWRTENYKKAAEIYEQGSRIAAAPPFMKLMAAKLTNEGGSRETARAIYKQMFEETTDTQTKDHAALRLLELDSLDERDLIRKVLQAFVTKHNRCVNNWREVYSELRPVTLGKPLNFDKNAAPLDPTGVPYLLVKENNQCEVDVDWKNSKIPLETQ